jgi:hypothetical protein
MRLAVVAARIDSRGGSGRANVSPNATSTSPGDGNTVKSPDADAAHHSRSTAPIVATLGQI